MVAFTTETRNSSFHQNIQINFGPTYPPIQGVLGFVSPVKSCRILKLTTHLYSVPRLTIRGTIYQLPICLHGLDRNDSVYTVYIYIYIYGRHDKLPTCSTFENMMRVVAFIVMFHPHTVSTCLYSNKPPQQHDPAPCASTINILREYTTVETKCGKRLGQFCD